MADNTPGGQSGTGGTQPVSNPAAGLPIGPIIESLYLRDCPGLVPDADQMGGCSIAPLCPDGVTVRERLFQRQVDRLTGEPLTQWDLIGGVCRTPEDPDPPPEPAAAEPSMAELVLAEWQQLQLPPAALDINPPGGRTLINFETIFYTDPAEQEHQVTILGQPVTIYAIPIDYTWHHGDGTSQTTTTPGAAYPTTDITHTYATTGQVTPRVDVRYRGEFSVADGPRQTIPGVAEVTGEPEALDILQARSRLVHGP